MGKESAIEYLRKNLQEFRQIDSNLSKAAESASDIITQLIEKSGLTFTDEESQLLENIREQYNILKSEQNFWGSIIDDDIVHANPKKISTIFIAINKKLGNPNLNAGFKQRIRACFLLTQNQARLTKLLESKQTRTKGSSLNDGMMVFGAIHLNMETLSQSIPPAFQYLPRQTLFVADWYKKVKKADLEDSCIEAVKSLGRKYKRASTLLNQIVKAVGVCKDGFVDPVIFSAITQTATTQAMENTPRRSTSPEKLDRPISITRDPSETAPGSSFVMPKKFIPVIPALQDLSDDEIDREISNMLDFSVASESSDRGSTDSTFLVNEDIVELANQICEDSNQLALPYKHKSNKKLPRPIIPRLVFVTSAVSSPKIPILNFKDKTAQQAIINFTHVLTSSYRPTLFGGGSKYKMGSGEFIKVPYHEKKMRNMLDSFNRQKLTCYHRLASDLLNAAIEAEFNKPLFNFRAQVTSDFYNNMFETLGVDVNESLRNIRNFIEDKDQAYWGTRFDECPSTVNNILSVINDGEKVPREKLKKVIYLAQVASETNGEMSIFRLRSKKTELFYEHFTHRFIKFNNAFIFKAYIGNASETIDEVEGLRSSV